MSFVKIGPFFPESNHQMYDYSNKNSIRLYVKPQNPFEMSFKLKLCSIISVPSLLKKGINAFDSFGIE